MNRSDDRSDPWLTDALDDLNQRERALDYVTTSRLSAARARALESRPRNLLRGAGLAAATASCLAALLLYSFAPVGQKTATPLPGIASQDLMLLSSSEDLEFFQTLEFIEWMEFTERESDAELRG